MPAEDAWGLERMPTDPPCADPELGHTTENDGWGDPLPYIPVTRTAFAMTIATALYGVVRLVVCKTGIHRTRRARD